MHYIRFLKRPKIEVKKKSASVKALVTIATDLGDDFLAVDVKIFASLVHKQETIALQTLEWKTGSRALQVELTGVHMAPLRTGCQLVVSPHYDILTKCPIHMSLEDLPQLHGVWSESFSLENDGGYGGYERRLVTTTDEVIGIYEDPGDSIARHLWDGGLLMCSLIRNLTLRPDQIRVKSKLALQLQKMHQTKKSRAIELGSGTGAVGIQLAHTCPKSEIILTDLPSAVDILKRNAKAASLPKPDLLSVLPLDWTEDLPEKVVKGRFDLILVSDCTYNTDSIPALVKTIDALMNLSPQALTVIATKVRHGDESVFKQMLADKCIQEVEHLAFELPDMQRKAFGQEPEVVDVYIYQRE